MSIPDVRMNVGSMSDQELVDLFEQAFADVADKNEIDDPEVACERVSSAGPVVMKVNVYGMAGGPTADTYNQGDGIRQVTISRADKGHLTFNHVPELTSNLGGNEYQVVYQSV